MIQPILAHDDALSLSMFWAGVLMVFTPLICAGVVIGIWWWQKKHPSARPTAPGAARGAIPPSRPGRE